MLPQRPSRPAARSGSAEENISARNIKPRSPSYKPRQPSPQRLPLPSQPQNKSQARCRRVRAYGHESRAGRQRNCRRRCARRGRAKAPRAEEESQPNPKSYRIHRTPCFLWQRGRHSICPAGAGASLSSPGSPHVSEHGRRLFFLSSRGRCCSPAPEADTCATQPCPGTLYREDGFHVATATLIPLSPSAPVRHVH